MVPSHWPSPVSGTLTSRALLAQACRDSMTSMGTHPEFRCLREYSDGTNPYIIVSGPTNSQAILHFVENCYDDIDRPLDRAKEWEPRAGPGDGPECAAE